MNLIIQRGNIEQRLEVISSTYECCADHPYLWTTCGCHWALYFKAKLEAPLQKIAVDFQRVFLLTSYQKLLLTGLNQIDAGNQKNLRVVTSAIAVTNCNFTLEINTWADTFLYSAAVTYIAWP